MPPRTNAFQKLILQLHQALGDDTVAEIRESHEYIDAAALVPREVDIVLFKRSLGREVHVAIECIDWKDPADVPWVDMIIGKHLDIPTDQIILVSSNGFTKGAANKARAKNMAMIVPEPDAEWGLKALRKVQDRYLSYLTLSVDRCMLKVEQGESVKLVRAERDYGLYDADGGEIGSIYDHVMPMLCRRELQREMLIRARSHPDACWFQIGSVPPQASPTLVVAFPVQTDPGNIPLFERLGSGASYLRNDRALERIVSFTIVGQFLCAQVPVKLKMGKIDRQRVLWGETKLKGKNVLVSGVNQELQLHLIPVRKRSAKKKATKTRSAKKKATKKKATKKKATKKKATKKKARRR